MAAKDALLSDLVAPVVTALGLELWGIEYLSQGRQATVRIYIDSPEGVSVEDCANVSRQVGAIFDVEEPIAGEYTLEVSSPGMDRPLFVLAQYSANIGEQVKLRLRVPYEGRKNYSGQLTAVEGDDVVVAVDEHEYLLPFDLIDRGNIIPRF